LLISAGVGLRLLGANALIVFTRRAEKNPDLGKRVAVAVARSWGAAAKDRAARDRRGDQATPLIRPTPSAHAWIGMLDRLVMTHKSGGTGSANRMRSAWNAGATCEGRLPAARPPPLGQIYDSASCRLRRPQAGHER